MAGRFAALFAALSTGSAANIETAMANSDPFADVEMSAADRTALATEFQAFVTEGAKAEREAGRTAGFKAANDRAVAVLNSDQGKAHTATALAFLANEKLASLSAEEIIASLPAGAAPAAAAPEKTAAELEAERAAAAAAAEPEGAAAAKARLEAAPKIALGSKAGSDGLGDGKGGVSKEMATGAWAKVQKPKGAAGAMVQ